MTIGGKRWGREYLSQPDQLRNQEMVSLRRGFWSFLQILPVKLIL